MDANTGAMPRLKSYAIALTEECCLCASFLFLIPPITSNTGQVYSFLRPPIAIGLGLFLASRLRRTRGKMSWLLLSWHAAAFVAFGWLIHTRIFEYPT